MQNCLYIHLAVNMIDNYFRVYPGKMRFIQELFGEPDANEYEEKKQELEVLKEQAAAGEIDLRYFDESGFSLNSNSPYAWQDKADPLAVKVGAVNRLMVSVL